MFRNFITSNTKTFKIGYIKYDNNKYLIFLEW